MGLCSWTLYYWLTFEEFFFFFGSFISLQDLEPSYPSPGILQPPSGWSLLQRYIIGISNFLPILVHSPYCYKVTPCSKSPVSYYQFSKVQVSSLDAEAPSWYDPSLAALSFSISQLGTYLHTSFLGSCVCTSGCLSLFACLSKSNFWI